MITLKEWNSFSQSKREKAAKAIFFNMPEWYIEELAKEWHHKLDAEHTLILKGIFKKKDSQGKDYYICRTEIEL